MALSVYSNPLGAAIQSGMSMFNELQGIDNRKKELALQQTRETREGQESNLRMDEIRQTMRMKDEEEPLRRKKLDFEKLQYEYKMLQGPVNEGLIETQTAAQEKRQPVYSLNTLAALSKLKDDSDLLEDDPKALHKQTQATFTLQQQLQAVVPKLTQHAQQTGQTKFRIDDNSAPGVVDNFNTVFRKANGGKEASAFLIDVQSGDIVPIMSKEDKDGKVTELPFNMLKGAASHEVNKNDSGTPSMKDDEGNSVTPTSYNLLQSFVTARGKMGMMLLSAHAQIADNPDVADKIEAQKLQMAETARQYKAIDAVPKDGTPTEKAEAYVKDMAKQGSTQKPTDLFKEAKEMFSLKDPSISPYQQAELDLRKQELSSREADRAESRRARLDAISEKKRDRLDDKSDKRRDKMINDKMHDLAAAPDWKDKTEADRREEAERLSDAQISGKSTKPPVTSAHSQEQHIKPLKDKFKNIEKDDLDSGYLISSAVKQGWTPEQIKKAAAGTPAEEDVKDYKFSDEKKPARSQEQGNAKAQSSYLESSKPAAKFKGQIAVVKDKSGKVVATYKSDGSKWVAQ